MRTVIMAAGPGERWGDHCGVPKQLVEIDGEPILRRTIRQVHEWTGQAPVVTVPQSGFFGELSAEEIVGSGVVEIRKFLNVTFDEPTLYLWGDVYFSDAAMRTIFATEDTPVFYGRYGGNAVKTWGELFAARLDRDAILKAKALSLIHRQLPRCASWELYRMVSGYPLHEHVVGRNFVEIDDETDDFDYPHDLDNWLAVHR